MTYIKVYCDKLTVYVCKQTYHVFMFSGQLIWELGACMCVKTGYWGKTCLEFLFDKCFDSVSYKYFLEKVKINKWGIAV